MIGFPCIKFHKVPNSPVRDDVEIPSERYSLKADFLKFEFFLSVSLIGKSQRLEATLGQSCSMNKLIICDHTISNFEFHFRNYRSCTSLLCHQHILSSPYHSHKCWCSDMHIMEDRCIYQRHADELLLLICITIPRITLVLVHNQTVRTTCRDFQFPNT